MEPPSLDEVRFAWEVVLAVVGLIVWLARQAWNAKKRDEAREHAAELRDQECKAALQRLTLSVLDLKEAGDKDAEAMWSKINELSALVADHTTSIEVAAKSLEHLEEEVRRVRNRLEPRGVSG